MSATTVTRLAGALLPSCAVLLGLYGLHSAWAAVLLYHLGIVGFALLLRGRRLTTGGASGETASPLASRVSPRSLLLGAVLMGALAGPAFYFLWPWLLRSGETLGAWLAQRGLQGLSWWLFVPYYSLVNPVLEEWHWSRLGEGLPARPGVWDALFAGYHLLVLATLLRWPWLFLVFAVLFGTSVFWRWMYRGRDTRSIPLWSHAVADLSTILAASLLLWSSIS